MEALHHAYFIIEIAVCIVGKSNHREKNKNEHKQQQQQQQVVDTLPPIVSTNAPDRHESAHAHTILLPPSLKRDVQVAIEATIKSNTLDLSSVSLSGHDLPRDINAVSSCIKRFVFYMPSPPMTGFTNVLNGNSYNMLTEICVTGCALTIDALDAFALLPQLDVLNISHSVAALPSNNRQIGMASPMSLLEFSRRAQGPLSSMSIPPSCYVLVGMVNMLFPKQSVAVVRLTQAVRSGDSFCIRRTNHEDFSDCHIWRSSPSIVNNFRTDAHVDMVDVDPKRGDDTLVAVRINDAELAQKDDDLLWTGRGIPLVN